jgi:hypothetical protein
MKKLRAIPLVILTLVGALEMVRLYNVEYTLRKTNYMIVGLPTNDTSSILYLLDSGTIDDYQIKAVKINIIKDAIKRVTQNVLTRMQSDENTTMSVDLCETGIHFLDLELKAIDSTFKKSITINMPREALDSLQENYRIKLFNTLSKHPDYKPFNYKLLLLAIAMVCGFFIVFYKPKA